MIISTFLFRPSEHFICAMNAWANKRPGVDAGWTLLFPFLRHEPRATQAEG